MIQKYIHYFSLQNNQTFEELKAQLQNEQPVLSANAITLIQTNGVDFASSKKYPLDVLLEKDIDRLPADVNPILKEACKKFCLVLS
jgi:hypothetical protein